MNSNVRFSRRQVLWGMVMAAAVPATLKLQDRRSSKRTMDSAASSIDHTLQLFTVTASAITLGRAYLRRYPDEDSLESLVSHLPLHIRDDCLAESDTELSSLQERIRLQVRNDFKTGNCVRIDGWVLSRTESRACALATFI